MPERPERIVAALAAVRDRSTGSAELAQIMELGWDQYDLGGAGPNVIKPLAIERGDRVLVWGAGSGVVVRFAHDRGAEVVGVEPEPDWLEAARLRTEGCDGIELRPDAPEPDGGFDLVIAAASPGRSALESLDSMLAGARGYLSDAGVVAAAVPSAVSVARLAGFEQPELPGVTGGTGQGDLVSRFEAADLEVGVVGYCYPDVFGAMAVLTDAAFAADDAVEFVDQVVGAPVSGVLGQALVIADDRALLRALVNAGAGQATAPGLLVVGGRQRADVARRLGEAVLGWRYTGGRRRAFQQEMTILERGGQRVATRRLMYDADPETTWLTHSIASEQPYVIGPNLEQAALAALRSADLAALEVVIGSWAEELSALAGPRPDTPPHPFLPIDAVRALPGDHLDVGLDNFTRSGGGLVFVDREWRCTGGVDLELVTTRALWKVAVSTVRNGSWHPWDPALTVREIWVELVALSPFDLDEAILEAWWVAEGQLQAVVGGVPPASVTEELRTVSRRTRLERAVHAAGVEAAPAIRDLDTQVEKLVDRLSAAHDRIGDLEQERDALAGRLDELRNMAPIRLARAVKWIFRPGRSTS